MNPQQARKLVRISIIAAFLVPEASFADIYKWVDAHGQVHFGDAAPKDGHTQVTTLVKDKQEEERAPAVPSQDLQVRQQRLTEQLREERLKREEAADRESERKQKLQVRCDYAKNRIEHIKSVNVFYDVNPDGTTRYLSDKEGDKLRKQANALYKQNCEDKTSFVSTR